jgi:hypothetical protein
MPVPPEHDSHDHLTRFVQDGGRGIELASPISSTILTAYKLTR